MSIFDNNNKLEALRDNMYKNLQDEKFARNFIVSQKLSRGEDVPELMVEEFEQDSLKNWEKVTKVIKDSIQNGVTVESLENLNHIQLKAFIKGAPYEQAIKFEGIWQVKTLEAGATSEQVLSFQYINQIKHFIDTKDYCESFKEGFIHNSSLILPEECMVGEAKYFSEEEIL